MGTEKPIRTDETEADEECRRAAAARRLDAVADILARGLARLLLAQASELATAPSSGLLSGNALIDPRRRAVMVGRGEPDAAEKGTT